MEHPNYIKMYYQKEDRHGNAWRYIVTLVIGALIGAMMVFPSRAESKNVYDPKIQKMVIEVETTNDEIVSNPYQTIPISETEMEELRWVVALESGNFEDAKAVCETIFNRVLSSNDWGQKSEGGAVHGVLSRKGQFSTYKYIHSSKAWKTPDEVTDDAISEVLRCGITVLPSYKYVYFDCRGGVNGRNHIKVKGGNTYGAER